MGATVCEAVAADADLELVAGIDVGDSLEALADAEVVVDFTVAAAARENLPWMAERGIHAVVGTTGLTDDDLAMLGAAFVRSNCVVAANFAIGAVLMMRFAELAAPWFHTAEIIELHHDQKIDAPSGTALATARRMAAASPDWAPDPTQHEVVAGARGGLGPANIRLHSVRMQGMVAHQEVILGTAGQTLTLRHDSIDRWSFMPGVMLACKKVSDFPGLTVGLDSLLGV
ncbi:MAG: dihydrodipicolinate reductase [Acidimicrobiia bacterium]|nr:dihydrodipicolinate reductase [Acidimicrobiia bacterium]